MINVVGVSLFHYFDCDTRSASRRPKRRRPLRRRIPISFDAETLGNVRQGIRIRVRLFEKIRTRSARAGGDSPVAPDRSSSCFRSITSDKESLVAVIAVLIDVTLLSRGKQALAAQVYGSSEPAVRYLPSARFTPNCDFPRMIRSLLLN